MVAAGPVSLFEKGVDAYRRSDEDTAAVSKALGAWQAALDEGFESGALYYNLGNVHFHLGHTAQAILFYERAKRLLPRDEDVTTNLSFARMAVVDRVNEPVKLIIWEWVDAIRDYLSLRELRLLFVWFGLATGLFVIAAILLPEYIRRSMATVVVVIWLLCGALFVWRAILDNRPFAIITAAKVDVKSAPDEASTDVFALHEGLKVYVRTNLAGWLNIELTDGRRGWIPAIKAEQI